MNDVKSYSDYWKRIQTELTPVKGFYEFDVFLFNKFEEDLRGGKVPNPCLVLEAYDNNTDGQPDNLVDRIFGGVLILDKFNTRQPHNTDARIEWLLYVEYLIKQVRAKMVKDAHDCRHPLQGLLIPSIEIRKTETIANEWQGFRMTFQFDTTAMSELDPSIWTQ